MPQFNGLGGLFSVVILVGISQHAARPTATYKTLELGGDAAAVGLIAGSYGLIALLFALPLGRKLDAVDSKPFLIVGIAGMVLGSIGSALAPTLLVLGVAQGLSGLGRMASQISTQVMVANRRHSNRDQGFARLAVATSLSGVIGPLLAGFALDGTAAFQPESQGTQLSFLLAAAFGICGLFLAARQVEPEPPRSPGRTDDESKPATVLDILRRNGVKQALFVGLTTTAILDLTTIYLPLLGEARGISPITIGTLLAVRAAAGFFSRIALTRLVTVWTRRRLLLLSLSLGALALFAVASTDSTVVLTVAVFIIGYVLGIGNPLTLAWLSVESPRKDRATALALRVTGNRTVLVVLPFVFGAFGTVFGAAALFYAMAGMLLSNAAILKMLPDASSSR